MGKRAFLLILPWIIILCVVPIAWTMIEGTPHDVNVMRQTTGLEPCAMCHTPHKQTDNIYPLWNRTQASQTYTMYESPTFDMVGAPGWQPRTPSTLCLTCHNGVASQLINYPGPGSRQDTNYDFVDNDPLLQSGQSNLGTDLRGEHPVSFDYDPTLDAQTDNNGFPASIPIQVGNTTRYFIPGQLGDNTYPLYGNGDDFECSTCHAVHHTVQYDGPMMDNGISSGTQVYFLRSDNSSSRMCTDCHRNR